jgi:ParB family chromosome partitioning protein
MTKERRLGRGLAALLGEDNEPVSMSQALSQASAQAAPAADPQPVTLRIHRPEEGDEDDGELDGPEAAASASSTAAAVPLAAGPTASVAPVISEAATAQDGDLLLLAVDQIDENPFQPRREFSESELASLSESLKEHDLLQPVLVRRVGSRWQLISGERRLRAAVMAGWKQIPARVRQADDRLVAELAIVENLQRKDLNAIEKALSFRRYLEQHRCTQEDLGRRLKIDRSTIANLMRLLELPEAVQKLVQEGRISAGHARALLPLGDNHLQVELSKTIEKEGMSVREAERIVQEKVLELDGDPDGMPATKPRRKSGRPAHLATLEQQLRLLLGTKVDLRQNARGRGQITIQFRSNEEFDRLFRMLQEAGGETRPRHVA